MARPERLVVNGFVSSMTPDQCPRGFVRVDLGDMVLMLPCWRRTVAHRDFGKVTANVAGDWRGAETRCELRVAELAPRRWAGERGT